MTTNDALEDRLGAWLEDTARPMPARALESALEALPRTRQVGAPSRLGEHPGATRWLAAAASLIVVVGTLAVAVGSNGFAGWFAGPSPNPAVQPGSWNAAADFRMGPDARNPSPDQAGNPGVWSYLSGPKGDGAPAGFVLLPNFDTDGSFWTDSAANVFVERQGTGLFVAPSIGPGDAPEPVVVRWRSPADSGIRISGLVGLQNRVCSAPGSGIVLTIFRNDVRIGTHTLDPLAARPFSRSMPISARIAEETQVRAGDTIDFVVSPGTNPDCLGTLLYLTIFAQ